MELTEAITLIDHRYLRGAAAGETAAPKRWADLGAGAGLFSRALGRLLPPGSTLHMVDSVPQSPVSVGEQIRVVPHTGDFEQETPDMWDVWGIGVLDGVLMANSLHYVADKPAFLSRLNSRLLPSGVLLLVEYDTDVPVSRWVPYPLSFRAAQDLLSRAGFTGVERISGKPSLFGRAPLYSVIGKLDPARERTLVFNRG